MGTPYQIDMSEYDEIDTDEAKIKREIGVPCRLCDSVFCRIRITWRYCSYCHKGFCEGEHGSFAGKGRAWCIQCGGHDK